MVEANASDPYWSRKPGTWEITDRQDPVCWGDGAGPLSKAQWEFFERNGYVIWPSLFSSGEVRDLLAAAHESASRADPKRNEDVITEPDSQVIRSVFRVHRTNAAFSRLAADARLAGVARQILGSEVYIHQSRINFKPGFDGREFYWHSDFETWHIEDGMPRMRALSASILLTENTAFNGPLMLVPGSHKRYVRCMGETPDEHYKQSLKAQAYGVPGREAMTRLAEEGGIVQAAGPAGSVVFFDCNIMHGSNGNISPLPRHSVFLVFNSVENRLAIPYGGKPPRPDFLAERDPDPVSSARLPL